MANTTKIVLRCDAFGPDGPDLGFLRLAADTVGWFDAISERKPRPLRRERKWA
jgi:hypothetical protein